MTYPLREVRPTRLPSVAVPTTRVAGPGELQATRVREDPRRVDPPSSAGFGDARERSVAWRGSPRERRFENAGTGIPPPTTAAPIRLPREGHHKLTNHRRLPHHGTRARPVTGQVQRTDRQQPGMISRATAQATNHRRQFTARTTKATPVTRATPATASRPTTGRDARLRELVPQPVRAAHRATITGANSARDRHQRRPSRPRNQRPARPRACARCSSRRGPPPARPGPDRELPPLLPQRTNDRHQADHRRDPQQHRRQPLQNRLPRVVEQVDRFRLRRRRHAPQRRPVRRRRAEAPC